MYATHAPSNERCAEVTSGSPKKVSRGTRGRPCAGCEWVGRGSRSPAATEAEPARKRRRDDGIALIEASLRQDRKASTSPGSPGRNRVLGPRVKSKILVIQK
jgi:hypothetical protein